MYINEMAIGSAVSVNAKNKEGKEVNLDTTIVGAYDGGEYKMVLVEALKHNGQILVFESVTCQAFVTNADDNKVYKFRLPAVVKREQGGKIYHCLISGDNASEENRRGAKRYGLSAKGTLQLLGTTSTVKGYVRDVSATGISFLASDANLSIGDKVTISFKHDMTGAQLRVVAQIVRMQEQDNDKGILYGCLILKHDAKYTLMVSYLMRQECKVRK